MRSWYNENPDTKNLNFFGDLRRFFVTHPWLETLPVALYSTQLFIDSTTQSIQVNPLMLVDAV
jgi:hypothetical protein